MVHLEAHSSVGCLRKTTSGIKNCTWIVNTIGTSYQYFGCWLYRRARRQPAARANSERRKTCLKFGNNKWPLIRITRQRHTHVDDLKARECNSYYRKPVKAVVVAPCWKHTKCNWSDGSYSRRYDRCLLNKKTDLDSIVNWSNALRITRSAKRMRWSLAISSTSEERRNYGTVLTFSLNFLNSPVFICRGGRLRLARCFPAINHNGTGLTLLNTSQRALWSHLDGNQDYQTGYIKAVE